MNKREVFQLLAERAGADTTGDADRLADDALTTFVTCMRSTYERTLSPVAGAELTVVFLRERGIGVAVDTGFDATIADMIMTRLRWPGRLVDVVVSSSDVPHGRPAPYMIFRAIERLGVLNVRRVMKIGMPGASRRRPRIRGGSSLSFRRGGHGHTLPPGHGGKWPARLQAADDAHRTAPGCPSAVLDPVWTLDSALSRLRLLSVVRTDAH